MLQLRRSRTGQARLKLLITYMFEVIGRMNRDELHAKIRTLGTGSEKVTMTIAQWLRKEGRKEGRRQERIDIIRRQLILKFRRLDAVHEARLRAATPGELERYIERVLTADSLAAVFENQRLRRRSVRDRRARA